MFRKLSVFVTIAEEGSLVAAARRLNVSQPGISVHLRQLEETLGIELIDRSRKQFRLTPEGQKLFDHAKELIAHYQRVVGVAKTLRHTEPQKLFIGIDPSTAHEPVKTQILSEYISACNEPELMILEAPTTDLFAQLENGEIDCVYTSFPVEIEGVEVLKIVSKPIGLLIPENHDLAACATIWQADLAGRQILRPVDTKHNSQHLRRLSTFDEIDWLIPPASEMTFRPHMVQLLGVPSFWVEHPETFDICRELGLVFRCLEPGFTIDFGFVRNRLLGRTADRFWNFAERNPHRMPQASEPFVLSSTH